MNGHSFRSVFMVASCAAAALGCYLVSLRVASERAALEDVETQIVLAQRDIRVLQTEIGTRGRLAQLERWNVKVLALSAPSADQFLGGGFELARLVQPKRKIDIEAPVVLAAAPVQPSKPQVQALPRADDMPDLSPRALMQTVSLKRELPDQAPLRARAQPKAPGKAEPKAAATAEPKRPASTEPKLAPKAATAPKARSAPAEAKGKPAAGKPKSASADPLAALKAPAAKPKAVASSKPKETTRKP